MIGSKEIPLLLMIVGGFVVVFCLSCLPGIITHDALSHELDTGDSMMFNRSGGIKDSFWTWDSMTSRGGGDADYQPTEIDPGDMQANPFVQ